jgi:hypothetical protein
MWEATQAISPPSGADSQGIITERCATAFSQIGRSVQTGRAEGGPDLQLRPSHPTAIPSAGANVPPSPRRPFGGLRDSFHAEIDRIRPISPLFITGMRNTRRGFFGSVKKVPRRPPASTTSPYLHSNSEGNAAGKPKGVPQSGAAWERKCQKRTNTPQMVIGLRFGEPKKAGDKNRWIFRPRQAIVHFGRGYARREVYVQKAHPFPGPWLGDRPP